MRTAILHTGERMDFDDTTPDHVMHKAVRARMGLPPPVPTSEELMTNALGAVQSHSEQMNAHNEQLAFSIRAMIQAFHAAAQQMAQAAQQFSGAVQHISMLGEGMTGAVQSAAQSAREAGAHIARHAQALHSTAEKMRELHGPVTELTKTLKTPKRAVKQEDGSWKTEHAE